MSPQDQILSDFRLLPRIEASSVCIGNFDGIHRGHQRILLTCLDGAKRSGLTSIVMTFHPHPTRVLRPSDKLELLFSAEEKRQWLLRLGFDFVLDQTFDSNFNQRSAQEFIETILKESLGTRRLTIGPDFRFGYRAEGDLALLQKNGAFEVVTLEPALEGGRKISSSWIREEVREGYIEKANDLLGHPYFLSGEVILGAQRGSQLGYRTANLATERECLPALGVYATIVEDRASSQFFCSATNVGRNPTFEGNHISVETHLIDFNDDLYRRKLRIYFLQYLRSEIKFPNRQELTGQIARDVEAARTFFRGRKLLRSETEKSLGSLKSVDFLTQKFQAFGRLQESLPPLK